MAIDEVESDPSCAWRSPAAEVEVHTPDGIEGSGSRKSIYLALALTLVMVLAVLLFVGVAGASAPGGCGGG